MASEIPQDSTYNTFSANRSTRVVMPVVPVVPRKFERTFTQNNAQGEQSEKNSYLSSDKGDIPIKEFDSSPVKSEILNGSEVKRERGSKESIAGAGQHSKRYTQS